MCGIAGIVDLSGKPISVAILHKMASIIRHRGPDDEGYLIGNIDTGQVEPRSGVDTVHPVKKRLAHISDPVPFHTNLGLAHRRLSVIDVTETGHQPMCSADGAIWLVYNGEIYNYVEIRRELEKKGYTFYSSSDTEVIIYAYQEWGMDCLQKFNGMWAFALWDIPRRKLFCARDRVGIKPFYYYADGSRFIFGSEIKAVIASGYVAAEPDLSSIFDYLCYQYVLGDRTFFKGVRKLLPGHYLVAESGEGTLHIRERCYWDPDFEPDYSRTDQSFVEELRWLLEDAVKLHLRSDVPLGCHLSGGIDSSTVTCLAARHYPGRINTFTGRFAEGEVYDETKWAKIVSDYAGTEYVETTPSVVDFQKYFQQILWHLDEPVVGPGVFPQYMVCQAASRHVKVVLGGQGGDELFGGYGWYSTVMFQYAWRHLLGGGSPVYQGKLRFLVQYAYERGMRASLGAVLRSAHSSSVAMLYERVWNSFSGRKHSLAKLIPNLGDDPRDRFLSEFHAAGVKDALNAMFKFDLRNYLQGLLHVEDRTSMAVSLESRVPLLDYRIVELAAKIPPMYKARNGTRKYILRSAVRDLLPPEILGRRDKMGFPTPGSIWLGNGDREPSWVKEPCPQFFDRDFIDAIYHETIVKRRDWSAILWRVMNVDCWAQTWGMGGSVSRVEVPVGAVRY